MELDWKEKTLDQLCSLRRELVEPSSSGLNRYIGLEHIDSGIPRLRRCGTDESLRSTKSRFYKGDVLYGKLRPYLDKAVLVEWNGVCSTDILTLRPNHDNVEAEYLSFLVHTSEFLAHAIATTSGVNHPRTSWASLAGFSYPVPSLPEQRAIAAVLSKIQAAMEVQDKIVATLKELKAATMAKLFREGLHGEPVKQTEIGEMPESWEVVSLGNVAQEIFGGGTPSTKQPEYWGGDIHWTTSAYISGIYLREGQRQITRRGLVNSASSLVPAGNLLIGTRVGVGKVSVNLIDIAISQDLTALVVKKDRYNPEFLAFALLTDRCQNIFELQKRGATIKGIPRDDLLQIHLAVPGLPEQQEIARKLLALHDKIEITVRKRNTLKSLFSSMLHLLMTGQVRVNHLKIFKENV